MVGKIFASIILVTVLYIFGVFFAPNLSDGIAGKLGIIWFNTFIRDLKNGADSTSETLLQIRDASGAINSVRGVVDQVNRKTEDLSNTINNIRQITEQKVEQGEKLIDSVRKVGSGITEVQQNFSELQSFSGTQGILSGQTNETGSLSQ